jgi:DNA adenine methylase
MANPIIPWIGGKRRLADHLIPRFPAHDCYVEVFAGGAALYFLRPPAKVEVINDINGELVNLYRVVQHHLEEFVRQFKWALTSRRVFEWLKDTIPETLTDIQRAARFYYLQKSCFGSKLEGQTFGTATTTPPGLNLLRIEEELSAAHLRLANTFHRASRLGGVHRAVRQAAHAVLPRSSLFRNGGLWCALPVHGVRGDGEAAARDQGPGDR